MDARVKGYWNIIFSYLVWGFLPIYWKLLSHFPALDILSNRIIWSFFFTVLILCFRRNWRDFFSNFSSLREVIILLIRSLLLSANWLIYIWGINHKHIIDCSFGYFIMPLVMVLMGSLFLKEKLNKWNILAFILALTGVLNLIVRYGHFPYVALSLALTFSSYALIRKKTNSGPISGLAAELAVLSIPAMCYLLINGTSNNWIYYSTMTPFLLLLLIGAGIITIVPLFCYLYGITKIKFNIVGMLQYINPTCVFIIGVFLYAEPFSFIYFTTFVMIWLGIAFFIYGNRIPIQREPLGKT